MPAPREPRTQVGEGSPRSPASQLSAQTAPRMRARGGRGRTRGGRWPGACVLGAEGGELGAADGRAHACSGRKGANLGRPMAGRMRARGGVRSRAPGDAAHAPSPAVVCTHHGGNAGRSGRAAAEAPALSAEARDPSPPGRTRGRVRVMAPLPSRGPHSLVRALGAAGRGQGPGASDRAGAASGPCPSSRDPGAATGALRSASVGRPCGRRPGRRSA